MFNQFKEETLKTCVKHVRFSVVCVILTSPLFWFLDYLMNSSRMFDFIIVRLLMMISMAVILYLTKTKFGKKNSMWLGVASLLFCSFFITILIHMTGGASSPYYAGLLILFFALCIWIPVTLKQGIVTAFAIYFMYVVPFLVLGNISNIAIFVNNNYFVVFIFFLSLSSLKFFNDIRFNEFKSRYDIQKAHEELKQLDNLKSQFFANVSHEVRTPLTSIISPLQTLIHGDAGQLDLEQLGLINQMHRNTIRLLDMINQMLDFSKIEAGKMQLRLEVINLEELINEMVTIFEEVTERKGIKLRFSNEGDISKVCLDRDKVERIFANLIRNAIKFTESGSIFVRSRVDEKNLVLEVEDTGIGIPADHVLHIFDRFRQVDGTTTRRFEGTGLGLTIVKESVDMMRGEISVKSEEARGTSFKIKIPMNLQEIVPDAFVERRADDRRMEDDRFTGEDQREGHRRNEDLAKVTMQDLVLIEDHGHPVEFTESENDEVEKSDKVLLIEDNQDLRQYVSKMLSKYGHEVITASDGLEGWEKTKELLPDIVVSDVMMPKMDGYDVLKNIKGTQRTMHIPVILITAKPELDAKIKGLETGADDYLPKPINVRELDVRIRNLVNMRRLHYALAKSENLDKRMEELAMSFAESLEARDFKTAGHSKDVLELGMIIANELGIPIDRTLKDSLLLHDIGKIGIPDGILLKEYNLSDDEWSIMKKHPEMGAEMLKNFKSLGEVSEIIMAHQEHWDGNGYPKGLKGEDIPQIARIIGVADAYHAMTNDRPYRKALSVKMAAAELLKCNGLQFDPNVVEGFVCGMVENNMLSFQEVAEIRTEVFRDKQQEA